MANDIDLDDAFTKDLLSRVPSQPITTPVVFFNHDGVNITEGKCPLEETVDDGKPREIESYLQHKDGQRIPVLIRMIAIRNESKDIEAPSAS